MLYLVLRQLTRMLLGAACRLRAVGLEHVPATGAVLLVSNHVSFLDPLAIGAAVRRPLHFMAKAELFRMPVLGGLVRRLNSHPVDRGGADAAALRLASRLLGTGCALLVFPEGTRGTEGVLRPGRPGVGMLAARAEVPVVPVYVRGTGRAWPRGARVPRPARITVACGPPLRFARVRGKTEYQAISDEIMAAIGRVARELEPDGETRTAARMTSRDRTASGRMPAGRIH